MRKVIMLISVLLFFVIVSINYNSKLVNFETVSSYSICYQPFIILNHQNLLMQLINIVILIATISMYFMGEIRRELFSTGIYFFSRYNSKQKWLRKKVRKIALQLLIIVCMYILLSWIYSYFVFGQIGSCQFNLLFRQIIMFYSSFLILIQLQITLEIYYIETIANTIIMIFAFLLINIYPYIDKISNGISSNLLFINNVSIYRSEIMTNDWLIRIVVLLLLNVLIYRLNLMLIKKKEVY